MTKRAIVVGINDHSEINSSGKSNISSSVVDADTMMDLSCSLFGFDLRSDFSSIYGCYVHYAEDA